MAGKIMRAILTASYLAQTEILKRRLGSAAHGTGFEDHLPHCTAPGTGRAIYMAKWLDSLATEPTLFHWSAQDSKEAHDAHTSLKLHRILVPFFPSNPTAQAGGCSAGTEMEEPLLFVPLG